VLQVIKDKLPLQGFKPDPRMTLIGLAGVAAAIALGVAYYLWSDKGAFRPLYGAGEAYAAADVMQVLDSNGIGYQLHPQSGQVLVQEELLGQARMLLSSNGVQVKVPSGYELFDKEEPLGTSQFVQDVRLKRSLEGELARTVMTLKGVESARVHLALHESSSFVVGKREPSKASVMLRMAAGQKLEPEQVSAIINLMAASVPQLDPNNVQVVDQFGTLLSRGLGAGNAPQQNWKVVDDFQNKALSNAEAILAPIVGVGNYRISVNADIDFSQKEETLQFYGDKPRIRSEVVRDESVLDQLALGVPGSLTNRPPLPNSQAEGQGATQEKGADGATSLRSEANRQLDYDQTVTHVKHAPFSLRQQSIAVVLNASTAPEGGWTDETRKELEAMIKSAVGFSAERGDVLTLSVFPFTAAGFDMGENESLPWWENSKIQEWAKLGLLALICLLLLFMVVRPAIRALTQRNQPAEAQLVSDSDEPLSLTGEAAAARLLAGEGIPGATILGELNPLAEIYLPAPGSGLEMQIEHLQMLAKNDPERVSEVLKQWIGRNERDNNPA
jgi:flagellar M-ring protein FliF